MNYLSMKAMEKSKEKPSKWNNITQSQKSKIAANYKPEKMPQI